MSSPDTGGRHGRIGHRIAGPTGAFAALAMALVLAGSAAMARAETGEVAPLTTSRTTSSDAYLAAVAGKGLQTPVLYLPPDVPLDAKIAAPAQERQVSGQTPVMLQAAAWIVLALFLAALGVAVWRGRRNLGELIGPPSRDFAKPRQGESEAAPEASWLDDDLISRLRDEPDPRIGLRLVLQRFLALAAKDNAVPLKRSLTTRELMHRLPGSWAHRGALEVLAERTELVVFGGRDIGREAYEECLDMAKPFLLRMSKA